MFHVKHYRKHIELLNLPCYNIDSLWKVQNELSIIGACFAPQIGFLCSRRGSYKTIQASSVPCTRLYRRKVTILNQKKRFFLGFFVLGTIALAMYVFNRLIHFFSLKNHLLSSKEGLFYQWRFGSIFYTKKGQGRPLLLIHDLTPFSSGHEWHLLENQLAKTNIVYTLDLLGCGRSDKPPITYTSFLYVQLLTDFLRNVVGESAQILGTGSSSNFIIEACHYDNTFIDSTILINPKSLHAFAPSSSKRNKPLRQLLALPLLGTFVYNLSINRNTLTRLLKEIYFCDSNKVTDLLIKTYTESSQLNKTEGKFLYACMISKLTNSNLFHSLTKTNTPLHIISSQEIPSNLDIAKEYQEALPSIELITLEKSNYLPQLETPEELLEQLKRLLHGS